MPFNQSGAQARGYVYFPTTDCSGTEAYVIPGTESAINGGLRPNGFTHVVQGKRVFVFKGPAPVSVTIHSYWSISLCSEISSGAAEYDQLEFVTDPPAYAPPLRVIRNPNKLFGDGFELGNPSRWSSAVGSVGNSMRQHARSQGTSRAAAPAPASSHGRNGPRSPREVRAALSG